ncbi:MAG: aminotransferase class I/II-fold pyridoxal phosphate-dependent enzyme [Cyclobacteriaceae bacterium]|nr:aminotransferase class I/II-fold pyridoxal phosphate-dependent enzyme [Cyclobacteriaceae bacterium]
MIKEANRLHDINEYYFSEKLQEIANLNSKGKDIINLGIGNPDMIPSAPTLEALTTSAQQVGNHGYQSYKGVLEFRNAIADWSRDFFNIEVNPVSEVLPLLGSKEGIMHISSAFVNPGDEVLVPNPGYPTYSSVSKLVGAKIRNYNLLPDNNWEINIEELKQQDLSKVKIMWVNYPHMPTGAKGSSQMFDELIELAKENQFIICNDNPYSLILNDNPRSIFTNKSAKSVALELNSMSKSHNMAGWRVGWVIGHEDYIKTILKVKSNVDSGMFLPVQHAAIQALNNSHQWHENQNLEYAVRRVKAWQLLDTLGANYSKDQAGLFIWAKVSDDVENVIQYVDNLIYKAGVFVAPGSIFGDMGERYIRISLCSTSETFDKAIDRIENNIIE